MRHQSNDPWRHVSDCFIGLVLLAVLLATPIQQTHAAASSSGVEHASAAGVDDAIWERRLQVAGNLRLSVSGYGLLGTYNPWALADSSYPQYPGTTSHSALFEFPAATRRTHLYGGGLWIGGIIGTDTLVTQAMDAISAESEEYLSFEPMRVRSSLQHSADFDPLAKAQYEFGAVFNDTLEHWAGDELDTDNVTRSMGLKVYQTSYSWLSAPYDDFIIVEYNIHNISDHVIESTYVGFCADADIIYFDPHGETDYDRYDDDVSGYLPGAGIAYAMDNDGEPSAAGVWDSASVRAAFGIAPIAITPAPCCTSFNWWSLGSTQDIQWGPTSETSRFDRMNPPIGDRNRYATMSNGEIDYDQLFAAVNMTEYGWRAPRAYSYARDIADGTDTRFLLSFGAWDLAPGDSVVVTLAVAAGDSVHQQPTDFANLFDAMNPEPYAHLLYFGDLIRNVEAARTIYGNGFDLVGAAPPLIDFTPMSDTSVRINWEPAPYAGVVQYRVFKRHMSGDPWQLLGSTSGSTLHAVDYTLTPVSVAQYTVAAVDAGGHEGFKSPPATYRSGVPLGVPMLTLRVKNLQVGFDWAVEGPGPGFSPYSCLDIYRRSDQDTASELYATIDLPIEQSSRRATCSDREQSRSMKSTVGGRTEFGFKPHYAGTWVDPDVETGVRYHYSLSVRNELGAEGERSNEVTAIPMAFDREGLVVLSRIQVNPDEYSSDSAIALLSGWALSRGFDALTIVSTPQERRFNVDMEILSHYRFAVFAWDYPDLLYLDPDFPARLQLYSDAGGRCVFSGRNVPALMGNAGWCFAILSVPQYSDVTFPTSSFVSQFLGVHHEIIECFRNFDKYPGSDVLHIYAQFRGANPLIADYPDMPADSGRGLAVSDHCPPGFECQYDGGGYVTSVGALDSLADDVEVLYTYASGHPDTCSLEGLPVAIRRIDRAPRFVLFNFPLAAMDRGAALAALDQAVVNLGGAAKPSLARQILEHLYHSQSGAPANLDLNRDGTIDLRDVVTAIDRQL